MEPETRQKPEFCRKWELAGLENERSEIMASMNKISFLLTSEGYRYDPNVSFFKRIVSILEAYERPMTTSEIVRVILKHEPLMDKYKTTRFVSAILIAKCTAGKIQKFPSNGRFPAYGLAEKAQNPDR